MTLQNALNLATEAHDGQMRAFTGTPYVWHPIRVATLVELYKPSRNIHTLRIAAVLHDTVEDTPLTLDIIYNEFGPQVASLVEELTSDKELQKAQGKAQYLAEKMKGMSSYALVIKLCDRLDNVLDLGFATECFREKYSKETAFILQALHTGASLTATHSRIMLDIQKHIKSYDE